MAVRLKTKHRLYLDDGLLILAAVSACVSTTLTLQHIFMLFLMNAAVVDPIVEDSKDILAYVVPLHASSSWASPLPALLWITIYSVKFSFLVFFRPLVQRLSTMARLYWTTVAATAAGFAGSMGETAVVALYRGNAFRSEGIGTLFAFTITLAIVDALTDMMSTYSYRSRQCGSRKIPGGESISELY